MITFQKENLGDGRRDMTTEAWLLKTPYLGTPQD